MVVVVVVVVMSEGVCKIMPMTFNLIFSNGSGGMKQPVGVRGSMGVGGTKPSVSDVRIDTVQRWLWWHERHF